MRGIVVLLQVCSVLVQVCEHILITSSFNSFTVSASLVTADVAVRNVDCHRKRSSVKALHTHNISFNIAEGGDITKKPMRTFDVGYVIESSISL